MPDSHPVDAPPGGRRQSRPARVAAAIKTWVAEQNLQPGDRLPRESELMAQFGVSKGTAREAMRLLQAQGLVETKTGPGGGSFVGAVSEDRARALLANYFYFREITIADIYQVRIALEPELAASLAGRLTTSQLAALEAIVAEYDHPARDIDEERRQHIASLQFHARLSDFSRNPLIGFFIGFLAHILTDLTVFKRLYTTPNEDLWRTGRAHQIDLIAALRKGDADAARSIMRSHMELAARMMADQEAEVIRRFSSD